MFRLHFAYMSLYQVLECHMEFLGLFGCIWSSKEVKYVIIGRAEQGSEVPQRRHEVAPKHLSERPSWSDPVKSLAIFIPLEAQSDLPRATPRGRSRLYGETTQSEARSDLSERLTEVAPGGRSDMPRSLRVYCWVDFYLLKGLLVISLCTFYISKTYVLNIFGSHQADYLLIY